MKKLPKEVLIRWDGDKDDEWLNMALKVDDLLSGSDKNTCKAGIYTLSKEITVVREINYTVR